MSGNTPTSLASRLKEQYNGDISNLVPGSAELVKLKFKQDLSLGKAAIFDVQLSDELGFSVGQGSVTLNGAIAQTSAKATVDAFTLVLQTQVSYDLITRASSSKKAFAEFSSGKFLNAGEAYQRRLEVQLMYGRDGLGKVTSNVAGVLTISADTFAPTIWLALKGAVLNAYTTKTGGVQHNGDVTVAAVDVLARTVTVTGTNAAIVANDHLFMKNSYDVGHIGLSTIAQNTGTLFGINAATNALWKAQAYDVGTSALTLGKILEMSGRAANFGCDEKLKILVPVQAFQGLVTDQSALRQFGANYSEEKAKNGFKNISFYGASGEVEIVPYKYIKAGECIMFPERWTYLIGSSKMVNMLDGDRLDFESATTTDREMRLFSDLQIFCERPSWIVRGTRSDATAL